MTLDNYNKYELPPGWEWKKLGDMCAVTDRDHRTPKYVEDGVPLISPRDFTESGIDFTRLKRVDEGELVAFVKKCKPEKGDVLYSRIGTIGEPRLLNFDFKFVALHSIALLKPLTKDFDSKYLLYLMQTPDVRAQAKHNIKSVGTPDLGLKRIKDFDVPVAPPDQQKRIVAEIEKQFSRLDEAVANLKRVKANLKRYKAAVLKAAVEGHLVETEAELARHESRSYETGEQLLQRILETRHSQWQGKGKYKEPAAPDTTDLPELPEGWTWCGFEQVSISDKHALKAGPFGSALKKEMYVESGYKIYGQEQVISGDPTFGDYFIDEAKYLELESCAVKPGDLLISLVGTAGKVLVLPPTASPGIINPRLLKLSLNQAFIAPAYAAYMLQSAWARHYFKLQAHGGTMEILNLGIIRALPVPLPPLDEQHRIVAEVDRRLSLVQETEAQVDVNFQRAERMRQSIFVKSFSGRMVTENQHATPSHQSVLHG